VGGLTDAMDRLSLTDLCGVQGYIRARNICRYCSSETWTTAWKILSWVHHVF